MRVDRTQWNRVRCILLPILKECMLSEDDIEVLEKLIAIVRTNSVDLPHQRLGDTDRDCAALGYAVFPFFSLLNHNCMANCRYHIGPDNKTITVRAMRPIKKGEEISISYIGVTLANIIRKQSFQRHWRFSCACKRCQDPTELGTYLQSIRCRVCKDNEKDGFMLPVYQNKTEEADSVANNSEELWSCEQCSNTMGDLKVRIRLADILQKTEFIGYEQSSEIWEDLLRELQTELLHPNNYLCMNIKRSLIYIYGNKETFDPSKDMKKISRKLELCRNYLDVYSTVDVGYSSWKGKLLEEMVGPMILLSKMKLANGDIDQAGFLECYKESVRSIKEAAKCRQYEPENSGNFLGWCIKEANDALTI